MKLWTSLAVDAANASANASGWRDAASTNGWRNWGRPAMTHSSKSFNDTSKSKEQILPAKTNGGFMTTMKSCDHGMQSLAVVMQCLPAVLPRAVRMILCMW